MLRKIGHQDANQEDGGETSSEWGRVGEMLAVGGGRGSHVGGIKRHEITLSLIVEGSGQRRELEEGSYNRHEARRGRKRFLIHVLTRRRCCLPG